MTDERELLDCDLVMRGGVASGIAYPEAIATLAQHYRLRSVGGTSAGAIAATIAAAAEHGRRTGQCPDSFDRLRRFGRSLGERVNGRSRIVSLFGAPPETRPLLNMFLAANGSKWAMRQLDPASRLVVRTLRGGGGGGGVMARLTSLGGSPGVGAMVAALPPALAIAAITVAGGPVGALIGLALIAAAIGVPIWAVGSVASTARAATDALPATFLGICTGMRPDDSDEEGLSEWMHRAIQTCAGLPIDDRILTFGDLARPDVGVKLQLITTNVTRGRSARLPDLEDADRGIEALRGRLYFRADEMRRLLPASVVDHMIAHAAAHDAHDSRLTAGQKDMHRLPPPEKLPILLGARMSLSFPILLSQVKLWSPDPLDDPKKPTRLEPCWFTDGGVTSNFPISIFDGPLPRWPTFGINLIPRMRNGREAAGRKGQEGHIRMPVGANDYVVTWLFDPRYGRDAAGLPERDHRSGLGQLLAYLGAIVDTARNWAETELTTMPGYRDRIVNIELNAREGGFNLDMPPKVIEAVAERGAIAARALLARFHPGFEADDPTTGRPADKQWERHRWVRLRGFLAAYEELGRKFLRGWNATPTGGARSYAAMLADDPPPDWRYLWQTPDQQAWARETAPRLLDTLEKSFPKGASRPYAHTFDRGDDVEVEEGRSPRPKMALRANPPRGSDPTETFTPLDDSAGTRDQYADTGTAAEGRTAGGRADATPPAA